MLKQRTREWKEETTGLAIELAGMVIEAMHSRKKEKTFHVSRIAGKLQKIIDRERAAERKKMVEQDICNHCHTPTAIRNQSGYCDHLRYPENCSVCFGRPAPEAWEEQFALLWGLAPKGSLKHKKGQEVKAFIAKHRQQAKHEAYAQMVDLYKPILEVAEYLSDMEKEIPEQMFTRAVKAMEAIEKSTHKNNI